jgi:dTDP-4-amino-4,6-dideoxygalactose transaminase
MKIPHSRPTLTTTDIAAAMRVLRSGQISKGPAVADLESAFAKRLKRSAAAVSSGTAGLHLALLALKVGKGDEVVLPTHVCSALLNAVRYVGAVEKLVDVRSDGNIDPLLANKAFSRRTKAMIVPHMWGNLADIKSLVKLGVPVIEDCAQSAGAYVDGKEAGTFGALAVFSFYATKMMASGEGGMVVSKDKGLISQIKDRLEYDHKEDYRVRFNYKMTDLQAALALSQYKQLVFLIEKRRKVSDLYDKSLVGLPVNRVFAQKGVDSVFYRYVLSLEHKQAKDVVCQAKQKGVFIEHPLYKPLHRYLMSSSKAWKKFPVSEQLYLSTISLPIYPSLVRSEQSFVVDTLKDILQ